MRAVAVYSKYQTAPLNLLCTGFEKTHFKNEQLCFLKMCEPGVFSVFPGVGT